MPPTLTNGLKTSEFILSLVVILIGVAMIVIGGLKTIPGLIEGGQWLVMTAIGGYTVSRGLAKIGQGGQATLGGIIGGLLAPSVPAPAAPVAPVDDKAAAVVVAGIK